MIIIKTIIIDENEDHYEINYNINTDGEKNIRSLIGDIKRFYWAMQETNKNLITSTKLASIIGVTPATITSMVTKENLPVTKIKRGNAYTYDIYELENYFRTRKPQYSEQYSAWLRHEEEKRNAKNSSDSAGS